MLDGSTPKITLLYSGPLEMITNANGEVEVKLWASELAKKIGESHLDIATIDKSISGSLLASTEFQNALQGAIIQYNDTQPPGYKITLSEVLTGKNAAGERVNNTSFWDIVSRKFASNANNVVALVPHVKGDSVFAQSELGAWLNNGTEDVRINGITKADLKATYNNIKLSGGSDADALTAVRDMVQASSKDRANYIEIVRGDNGEIIKAGWADEFKAGINELKSSPLPDDTPGKTSLATVMPAMKDLDPPTLSALSSGLKHLDKLGYNLDILSLALAITEANTAYANGDTAKANDIMAHWAADYIGGTAGGWITARVLMLVIGTSPPAIIATVILSFLGGYLGSVGAASLLLLEKGEQVGLYLQSEIDSAMENLALLWDGLSSLINVISDIIDTAYHQFLDAVARSLRVDPLIIDMAGDGLSLDSWQTSTALFDLNEDGTRENTGWTKAGDDDAFLVIDKNANGNIDDISEMFGNATTAGFTELKLYDSNQDNLINSTDTQFSLLKLWNDANANGTVDAGEMTTLAANGITQISLNKYSSLAMIEGNLRTAISIITKNDGSTRNIHELFFGFENTNTITTNPDASLPASFRVDIASILMPYSRGYGSLYSWQAAMTLDPALLAMAQDIIATKPADFYLINNKFQNFLFKWAGVENVKPEDIYDVRISSFDARKMAFMEKVTGLDFLNGTKSAVALAEKAWNLFFNEFLNKFLVQGNLREIFPNAAYDFASDTLQINDTLDNVIAHIETLASSMDLSNFTNYAFYAQNILKLNKD